MSFRLGRPTCAAWHVKLLHVFVIWIRVWLMNEWGISGVVFPLLRLYSAQQLLSLCLLSFCVITKLTSLFLTTTLFLSLFLSPPLFLACPLCDVSFHICLLVHIPPPYLLLPEQTDHHGGGWAESKGTECHVHWNQRKDWLQCQTGRDSALKVVSALNVYTYLFLPCASLLCHHDWSWYS